MTGTAAPYWLALFAAVTLDLVQVFALDSSEGFSRALPIGIAAAALLLELLLFAFALRGITPSTGYALFGLGTAAVAVISVGWLGEQLTLIKAIGLTALIGGAVLIAGDKTANRDPHASSPQ